MNSRLRTPYFLLLVLAVSSCAQYSHIPRTQYKTLDESPGYGYRITRTDGDVHLVKRLVVSDSSFVVLEAVPTDDGETPIVRFTVPIDSVASLEAVRKEVVIPALAALTVVGVVVWILYLFSSGFPSGG